VVMKIYAIEVGPIRTNCYIATDGTSGNAAVIDPGEEPEKLCAELKKHGLVPEAVFLTHGHYDHVTALASKSCLSNKPVYIHKDDLFLVSGKIPKLASLLGFCAVPLSGLSCYEDGQTVEAAGLKIKVIHTPGHTPGGVCLYIESEKTLFSGDTLFCRDCGRVDLPLGSEEQMAASLKKILALPAEVKVYPGHGRSTTIASERKTFADIL